MTPAEQADLLARLTRMASVGATILSNATQARKIVERQQVDTPPAPYGTGAYGEGPYGG